MVPSRYVGQWFKFVPRQKEGRNVRRKPSKETKRKQAISEVIERERKQKAGKRDISYNQRQGKLYDWIRNEPEGDCKILTAAEIEALGYEYSGAWLSNKSEPLPMMQRKKFNRVANRTRPTTSNDKH